MYKYFVSFHGFSLTLLSFCLLSHCPPNILVGIHLQVMDLVNLPEGEHLTLFPIFIIITLELVH